MADGTKVTGTGSIAYWESVGAAARARWKEDHSFSLRYFRGELPCDDCATAAKRGEKVCASCAGTGHVVPESTRSLAWYADSVHCDAQDFIGGIADVVARSEVEGAPAEAGPLLRELAALAPLVALAAAVANALAEVLEPQAAE